MVNTKTSEKFFSTKDGKLSNPQAGTLIHESLVSNNYDFFLISQKTNNGTVVPNHFRVVFSNSKMEEGMLQEIVFSQCFNYVNWTGSIKVPSILQYAKKAALFRSDVLGLKEVPESMEKSLYFI